MGEVKPNFDAALILSFPDNKPFLYLGSQASARVDPQTLREKYNIGHVLNVTDDLDNFHDETTVNRIVYKRIPIKDFPRERIEDHWDDSHDFLREIFSKHNPDNDATGVLVHCNAGISRSGSIVISYLVKHNDMTLNDAIQHVKKARPVVLPNLGFIQKLQAFEKQVRNTDSVDFHQYAVNWLHDFCPQKEKQEISRILRECNDDVDDCMDVLFQ